MKWRLMTTAPQDGTEILIWDRVGFVDVAFWNPISLRWTNGDVDLKPTHWMPLPEPPR